MLRRRRRAGRRPPGRPRLPKAGPLRAPPAPPGGRPCRSRPRDLGSHRPGRRPRRGSRRCLSRRRTGRGPPRNPPAPVPPPGRPVEGPPGRPPTGRGPSSRAAAGRRRDGLTRGRQRRTPQPGRRRDRLAGRRQHRAPDGPDGARGPASRSAGGSGRRPRRGAGRTTGARRPALTVPPQAAAAGPPDWPRAAPVGAGDQGARPRASGPRPGGAATARPGLRRPAGRTAGPVRPEREGAGRRSGRPGRGRAARREWATAGRAEPQPGPAGRGRGRRAGRRRDGAAERRRPDGERGRRAERRQASGSDGAGPGRPQPAPQGPGVERGAPRPPDAAAAGGRPAAVADARLLPGARRLADARLLTFGRSAAAIGGRPAGDRPGSGPEPVAVWQGPGSRPPGRRRSAEQPGRRLRLDRAAQTFLVGATADAVGLLLLDARGVALDPDPELQAQIEGFFVRQAELTSQLVHPDLLRQVPVSVPFPCRPGLVAEPAPMFARSGSPFQRLPRLGRDLLS